MNRIIFIIKVFSDSDSMTDLHYTYRMVISTISGIIEDVCKNIWELKT